MEEMGKKRNAYPWPWHTLGNLRQVDLVAAVAIAQSVLDPLPARRRPLLLRQPLELLDRPVPFHLQVHAYPAVQRQVGEVQAHVGHPRLDDLGEQLVRLLVVRHPDLRAVAPRRDGPGDAHREHPVPDLGGKLKKLVDLVAVEVVDGEAGPREGGVGLVVGVRLLDLEVEELVEGLVLDLVRVNIRLMNVGDGVLRGGGKLGLTSVMLLLNPSQLPPSLSTHSESTGILTRWFVSLLMSVPSFASISNFTPRLWISCMSGFKTTY